MVPLLYYEKVTFINKPDDFKITNLNNYHKLFNCTTLLEINKQ